MDATTGQSLYEAIAGLNGASVTEYTDTEGRQVRVLKMAPDYNSAADGERFQVRCCRDAATRIIASLSPLVTVVEGPTWYYHAPSPDGVWRHNMCSADTCPDVIVRFTVKITGD